MSQPIMRRAKGDGIDIQLAEWPGEGRPLFCVHGLTANSRCFDRVAESLAPAHRVLAMDLRGRGLSDKPDTGYSIEHHCRDIEAVLADLGIDQVTMMGHSLGAFISLAFTATRPDRVAGLVLMDGGAQLSPEQWAKISLAIKPSTDRLVMSFPSFQAYLDHVRQAPYLSPWNDYIETYFRYECHEVGGEIRSRIRPENIQEEAGNLVATDTTQWYGRVGCPVLVIRAARGMVTGDDLVMPDEATAELVKVLPRTRMVTLTDLNHYSMIFQPSRERDEALTAFLAG